MVLYAYILKKIYKNYLKSILYAKFPKKHIDVQIAAVKTVNKARATP